MRKSISEGFREGNDIQDLIEGGDIQPNEPPANAAGRLQLPPALRGARVRKQLKHADALHRQDNLGRKLHVGDRVHWRGQIFTIKSFTTELHPQYGNPLLEFDEPLHLQDELPCEFTVDLFEPQQQHRREIRLKNRFVLPL